MTRAEIRIAAAKRREKAANAALSRAYERKRAAIEAATKKTLPAVWAAEKKCREARAAVTLAQLAEYGITPMQTIILWHPRYTAQRDRYVVTITREGWARLVPVTARGRPMKGRATKDAPWKWSDVTVTDEVFQPCAS